MTLGLLIPQMFLTTISNDGYWKNRWFNARNKGTVSFQNLALKDEMFHLSCLEDDNSRRYMYIDIG